MKEIIINLAGIISSMLFMMSQLPMLYKAYKTHDLKSYSLTNLSMALSGDLLYWVYLLDLPVGLIWLLHCFDTLCSMLMLYFYLHYSFRSKIKPLAFQKLNKHII